MLQEEKIKRMAANPKILLVDDDEAVLEMYQAMLSQHLPSAPDVRTAATGVKALAMLDSENFTLLIVDLNMPRMDGLQVLSIARRKYPQLRLVVLTGIRDEQFRTRAYAMGVDQYWIKPESEQEMGLFLESIESSLSRELQGGFRGVQSKSLVDIIQIECLSQSSCLLKITNGVVEGKVWIQQGEVIDAEAQDATGELAFQKIFSWKTGNFEILPGDAARTRTIFTSYQGLLLNTAQQMDEAASQNRRPDGHTDTIPAPVASNTAPLLAELSQLSGVDFALAIGLDKTNDHESWGLENPKPAAAWTRQTLDGFRALGERLQVGQLQHIVGVSRQRKVALSVCPKAELCVGFQPGLSTDQIRETMKTITNKWAS